MRKTVWNDSFINMSAGVFKIVHYFCESELEVYSKIRVAMEFMQQDLTSVTEIFGMI